MKLKKFKKSFQLFSLFIGLSFAPDGSPSSTGSGVESPSNVHPSYIQGLVRESHELQSQVEFLERELKAQAAKIEALRREVEAKNELIKPLEEKILAVNKIIDENNRRWEMFLNNPLCYGVMVFCGFDRPFDQTNPREPTELDNFYEVL